MMDRAGMSEMDRQLRKEQAPLPAPRLFTKEQLQSWMDEDEEDMRLFRDRA